MVDLEEALSSVDGVFTAWRRWRTLHVPPWDGGFMGWPAVLAESFEVLSAELGVFEVWELTQQRAKADREVNRG